MLITVTVQLFSNKTGRTTWYTLIIKLMVKDSMSSDAIEHLV